MPFNVHALDEVGHVPCATVLVQLRRALRTDDDFGLLSRQDVDEDEWERLGLWRPVPNYASGVFDSSRCQPTRAEMRLYPTKARRKGITIRELLEKERTSRNAAFAKLPPAGADDGELDSWVYECLNVEPPGMMDMTYISEYNEPAGFAVRSYSCVE